MRENCIAALEHRIRLFEDQLTKLKCLRNFLAKSDILEDSEAEEAMWNCVCKIYREGLA